MLILAALAGCTWVLVDEPCDTGPEIEVSSDALWRSESANWQQPVVGTGFICGLERTDDGAADQPPSESLTCVGPAVDTLQGYDGIAGRRVKQLSAGGSILCMQMEEESGGADLPAYACWGEGARGALENIALDLEQHPGSTVEELFPAEGYLCATIVWPMPAGAGNERFTSCQSDSQWDPDTPGPVSTWGTNSDFRIAEYGFVATSANMACGVTTVAQGGAPTLNCDYPEGADAPPAFEWDSCLSTFDVADGVICATNSPDPTCSDEHKVICGGDPEHPFLAGLEEEGVKAQLEAQPTNPSRIDLGADFGCVHFSASATNPLPTVLCWGDEDSAASQFTTDDVAYQLAIAPEATHACGLMELDETVSVEEPRLEMGRLSCWGDVDGEQPSLDGQ